METIKEAEFKITNWINQEIEETGSFSAMCSREDSKMGCLRCQEYYKLVDKLLSLVAEKAFIEGRTIYLEKIPIGADKLNITAEHQTFEDYWKSITDTLKT